MHHRPTCSANEEFGLHLEEGVATGIFSGDVNIVLEGRGTGGDIEAEVGGPLLTDLTGRLDAVAVVVAFGVSAGPLLIKDLSTGKVALNWTWSRTDPSMFQ